MRSLLYGLVWSFEAFSGEWFKFKYVQVFSGTKVSLWLSQEETRGSSFASNEQLLRIWMEASFIEASNWGFVFLLALALSHSSLFLLGFMVLLHYYYISFLGAFFLSTFQSHATCM